MPIPGMNNTASPVGLSGIAPTAIKNMEFWPPGHISRRRGFAPYIRTPVVGSPAIFDSFVFDRLGTANARWIDIVARVTGSSLMTNRVCTAYVASTGGTWTKLTNGFANSTLGGQGFTRNNLFYYSEGDKTFGYGAGVTSGFTIGLSQPVGKPGFSLTQKPSRMEPGFYDYCFTAYDEERNVESLPSTFTQPSTIPLSPTSTRAVTAFYSMGQVPSPAWCAVAGWANMSFDSTASTVNIYRRHPMDSYYRASGRVDDVRLVTAHSKTPSSYTDRLNDGELLDPLTFTGTPPKPWIAACEYNQRYWYVFPGEPWKIWFSEVDSPEMVGQKLKFGDRTISPILDANHDLNYRGEAWIPVRRGSGGAWGLVVSNGALLVLCHNQTWQITGSSPGTFQMECIDESVGCVAPKSSVATPYGVLWLDQQGVVWWRGGRPFLCSKGVLDFEDSNSAVRWNTLKLRFSCAAYDPVREQVEFAVPSYGSGGNDMLLCLHLALSTPQKPVFTYHVPTMAAGETITSMCTLNMPVKQPAVVYMTNRGRALFRNGSTDHNGDTFQPIEWQMDFWVGQRTSDKLKSNAGMKLVQDCRYDATVGASFWSRETARQPRSTDAVTRNGTLTCSSNAYGATEVGIQGNFLFLKFRESASTPFSLQNLVLGAEKEDDWRIE